MATEVVVRAWTRRDRSAIERWPRPDLPDHWTRVEPVDQVDRLNQRRQSWAIERAGELVGRITLRNATLGSAELGIYLRPDCYGQGIGSAALLRFGELDMRMLIADVAIDNLRAMRCYQRAGFRPIAIRGEYVRMVRRAPNRAIPERAPGSAAAG